LVNNGNIYNKLRSRGNLMHRILIIEDDSVIADAIKKHISTWGCEAKCIEDFSSVMAEFVNFDPQLVLLDISLPFFNGLLLVQSNPPGVKSADYLHFLHF